MSGIPTEGLGGWGDLPFFKGEFLLIEDRIQAEAAAGADIWPRPENIFRALRMTQPEAARVVIIGQDPYPTPGHAHGLAFSVPAEVRPLAASLRNIFKELKEDVGAAPPNGDLSGWAAQGVLLLNTALTVRAGEPASHAKYGWSGLIEQVIDAASAARPMAFILWGKHAQGFRRCIQGDSHLILESAHPSPLSAKRGFFGSKPFSRVNAFLEDRGEEPIDWGRAA